jgi:hypothetical protein
MTDEHPAAQDDPDAVLRSIQAECGAQLTQADLPALLDAIAPYLQRTALPLSLAIPRIAGNYLRDGTRVRKLLSSPDEPEWQCVLEQVHAFATHHRMFPADSDATTWPDLDAFEDIRRKLDSYNFEGTFDSWIGVTVVRRLTRFWRDQQALRMGGAGIQPKAVREAAREQGSYQPGPRARQRSLDELQHDEVQLVELLQADQPSVAEQVEAAELQRLLNRQVHAFATARNDPALASIWHAVVNQHMKLREVGVQFGLSIAQVNRRIEQVREFLRHDPSLIHWLKTAD